MKIILKKLLSLGFVVIMLFVSAVAFVGCDADSDVAIRVKDGYVQWKEEDSIIWYDIISIDDILASIGDEIKGEVGPQGVAGKQVEFSTNSTHILWRYVGESEWKNLVAFSELEQKDDPVDVDELNQRGYNLFVSKLDQMNSNYKVTYEYADLYIVESFLYTGLYIPRLYEGSSSDNLWGSNILNVCVAMEYCYGTTIGPGTEEGGFDKCTPYALNIVGESNYGKVATNNYVASCLYVNDISEYKTISTSASVHYMPGSYKYNDKTDFKFVSKLKSFEYGDVISCEFNSAGDCILSIGYSDYYNSAFPYLKSDYIYDFCITKDGEIQKCYIYEKGFLDSNEKGDLFCKISYEKGESLIERDLIDESFEIYKEFLEENYPDKATGCIDWYDVFMYKEQN